MRCEHGMSDRDCGECAERLAEIDAGVEAMEMRLDMDGAAAPGDALAHADAPTIADVADLDGAASTTTATDAGAVWAIERRADAVHLSHLDQRKRLSATMKGGILAPLRRKGKSPCDEMGEEKRRPGRPKRKLGETDVAGPVMPPAGCDDHGANSGSEDGADSCAPVPALDAPPTPGPAKSATFSLTFRLRRTGADAVELAKQVKTAMRRLDAARMAAVAAVHEAAELEERAREAATAAEKPDASAKAAKRAVAAGRDVAEAIEKAKGTALTEEIAKSALALALDKQGALVARYRFKGLAKREARALKRAAKTVGRVLTIGWGRRRKPAVPPHAHFCPVCHRVAECCAKPPPVDEGKPKVERNRVCDHEADGDYLVVCDECEAKNIATTIVTLKPAMETIFARLVKTGAYGRSRQQVASALLAERLEECNFGKERVQR